MGGGQRWGVRKNSETAGSKHGGARAVGACVGEGRIEQVLVLLRRGVLHRALSGRLYRQTQGKSSGEDGIVSALSARLSGRDVRWLLMSVNCVVRWTAAGAGAGAGAGALQHRVQ